MDPTRHTNESKMRYAKEDDEESGSDMDISVDEQQEEPEHVDINMDAYQYSEDAGLIHLVHAWIQQNQRSKVCLFCMFHGLSTLTFLRDYSYLVISRGLVALLQLCRVIISSLSKLLLLSGRL